jgi:hypothetical protein
VSEPGLQSTGIMSGIGKCETKRTERTTAREQTGIMVRGGCYRDGKDNFDFVCSRGSNRRSLALSGNMTRQRDCDLRVQMSTRRQAVFCRRRHQPRRPPLAKIRPGSPAPTIGPGTGTPGMKVSGPVPKENVALEIVVALVTPA